MNPKLMRTGGVVGILSLLCYFGAAFMPLPAPIARLLAFAFGPLLVVGFIVLYDVLRAERDGLVLRSGVVFAIAAGVIVTTLLTVQMGNGIWLEQSLAEAATPADEQAARTTWRAVNRVQALMDVAWDVFLCAGSVLFGLAMWGSRAFGLLWGASGIALALLLLALNLYTFPDGPAYAGLFDAGPLLAAWYGAVFIRMLLVRNPPLTAS